MAVCCWWCISRVGLCCTNQQFYFTIFHWIVSTIVEWPWNGLYRNSVNMPLGVCEIGLFVGTMGCPLYYCITTESPWWKHILGVHPWAEIYLLWYGQVEFVSVGLFNFFVWCTRDAVFFCECITCHPRLLLACLTSTVLSSVDKDTFPLWLCVVVGALAEWGCVVPTRYTIASPPNRPGGNLSLVWIPGQRYISFGMARWSLYQLNYLNFCRVMDSSCFIFCYSLFSIGVFRLS